MTDRRHLLQEALSAVERLEARLAASERAKHEPIAIIGAGCRYPGGIEDPEGLWRVVRDGVDAVTEVPSDRWDASAYYDPDPKAPGKMVTKRGGFLSRVDGFDPHFFGISPREASTMDPQQRLLLETATEALESAGQATDRLAGSATGVFVGITTSDYGQLLRAGGPETSDVYSATGSALNAAAGRISFTFGFQGPCVSVDTACSSSLVAVHLACQSLRAGESDLALAGGVNVILSPDAMILFSKWGMMAPDGACKTFDAAADGFVRAEGCAMIALKRLPDAIAAGDPVLAVIRGSAVNSDGRSSGLTVPNGPAQQSVVRRALANARLEPVDIDYVEAHGTGTSLGDPIEVEALAAVMRKGRAPDRPLLIGSIKTNLGHTEAASGLAGLLKVVMALRHEAIPPHLHYSTPSPAIPWSALPVAVPTTLTPWLRGERARRAGVSSFGFSGTNAHVVLEEAPLSATSVATEEPVVVPLSARGDAPLRELARRWAHAIGSSTASLAEIAHTAGSGRAHHTTRCAIVADSIESLTRDLRDFGDGALPAGVVEGTIRLGERPKIAFLFTGQGSQYAGMGRGLYESEPVFREMIDRAATILTPILGRSLVDVLYRAEDGDAMLGRTRFTQPALFALECALAELWRSRGITPAVVLGHSVGEYAAACVAGVFSFDDGLTLIAERGRAMDALPEGGAMAAVFASEARVAPVLESLGGRLSIAALNGPEETVLSGDADALAAALASFTADGIQSRPLEVSHAFHSARLDPMLDALERRAAAVSHAAPRIPLISNLTGTPFPAGTGPDARYWRRHAREPVRFAASIQALAAAGATALVEIGPHPTLLGLVGRTAPGASWATIASARRGRDDRREMLAALGALFVRGANVQWDTLNAGRQLRRVSLPTYPFQRERYWVPASAQRASTATRAGHPLLGEAIEVANSPGAHLWQSEISLETHPWLADHRVQGAAIVPATAYIEMALASAGAVMPVGSIAVREIENLKPLILHEGVSHTIQATLSMEPDGSARFGVHSRPSTGSGGKRLPWTAHVTARIEAVAVARTAGVSIDEIRARCTRRVDGPTFYAGLARKGNQWGPAFQGLEEVWIGEREAIGRVRVAPMLSQDVARYRFHPAVSDACGHTLVATVPIEHSDGATGGAFVGGGVGEVRFHASPTGSTLWVRAALRSMPNGSGQVVIGDVFVHDESGALVTETFDARLWYLEEGADAAPADWFYEPRWEPAPAIGARGSRGADAGPWIVLADRSGVGERIAARRAAAGERTMLVLPGDAPHIDVDRAVIRPTCAADYRAVIEAVGNAAAVVDCWSADGTTASETAERAVCLLQGVLGAPGHKPRLWLVSRDSQAVAAGDQCRAPGGAALWGLGRSLSAEHAELWGGLVDIGRDVSSDAAAEALIREIETGSAEDKIALRTSGRFVARLARRGPNDLRLGYEPAANGTYVVTGGLGGVGLAMARWLAERGARHLLLLGRTPLPPRGEWDRLDPDSRVARQAAAVASLESLGANVQTAALDVAEPGPLERCLAERRDRGEPPVRGVFHAAGILNFQPLATQGGEALRAQLAAKVDGAWRLHELFAAEPLDAFVLCSSTSALLASPLLGGYAAGNAFLDALAHYRRAQGLPALSVNWGTWGEVGMAVEAGRSASGDMLAGVDTIPTARGLAALAALLGSEATQAAVMPVDWRTFATSYPQFASDPFLSALVGDVASAAARQPRRTSAALMRAAANGERTGVARSYLRDEAARALGMTPDRLETDVPLSSLGFDSLMAVQLKNQIGTDLGVVLPMILFLQGPSIDELVPPLLEAIGSQAATVGGEASVEQWEEGSL